MYNYAIIGGGIVGLAIAMTLGQKYPAAKILVLEKEAQWAFHQTGHNSGVIHSGIYYKPGSFKAKFCRSGCESMVEFCQTHDLPHEVCGKLIIASTAEQLPLLENLYQRGLQNNIPVKRLNADEVKEYEPYVHSLAGIRVCSTGIVDYQQVCLKYKELIENQGGDLYLNSEVTKIKDSSKGKIIETIIGDFESQFVINCGGLYSDRIAKLDQVDPVSLIVPFRGEYYELIPEKRYLVNGLIYPVPNPEFPFLGVHFTRMIDGSVHAGPNAVLSFKREGYLKTDFNLRDSIEVMTFGGFWKLASKYTNEGLKEIVRSFSKAAFVQSLQQLIPDAKADDVVPAQAGVRAQALGHDGNLIDDFLILSGQRSVHICNAPSPAATASLEIGKAVVDQVPSVDQL